jgi:alkaline phosphatase
MQTLLELAHAKGLGTGVIATSTIQDATPAAFYSHQPSRLNYEEISEDFLEGMVDLAIGGGRRLFVDRRDGRNILDELEAEGYGIARNLRQARRMTEPRMMVITATGHLSSASRRNGYLPEATAFAAGHLQRQYRKGFFLMVEGSQIDFGGHSNDADYLIPEFLDFDQAVGAALDFAEQDGHTLVVVTADHETGGMSLVNGLPEQPETHEIGFITERHTAAMVPVFAYGPGAELFTGIYDNTGICYRLKAALGW